MFGKKQIQELEAQLQTTREELNRATSENASLREQLEAANRQIAALKDQLHDFDLEKEKETAAALKAEYEGLRNLYRQKNQEFDDSKEEKEQTFARDQAIQRHNLENEIRDNRQANQDYVANTVRTFGESYNYYLNQIKVLMDALGSVAAQTGEALFSQENADLKARFDSQMRGALKSSSVGALQNAQEDAESDGDTVEAEIVPEPPVPVME